MAEKLQGLLDTAKSKLTGLLGDFPQGFNAGAVAGLPGWAGDMAYMADTARLALTGADQQAAPENYVGTTDYIAKQAGYPVPQTLSGQLGAAVGGLMSPGPGDLAKFAPVLSAIPFWHGSPHKFDRFDLSHMGKGEGAQAYGYGAYGAESPEVATQYQKLGEEARINGQLVYQRMADHVPAPQGMTDTAVQWLGLHKWDIGETKRELQGLIDNAENIGDKHYYSRLLDQFKDISQEDIKVDTGNLYRGEYRWPDPQKEAATPLTGEDLLQWDRPLSEQPEHVQQGVKETWAQSLEAAGKADESAKVRAMDSLPDWVLERPGERVFSLFGGMDRAGTAEKALAANGIPGIRYLDGMSRTDGAGTHNIVMFSDEGIKLLERNGKPIEDFAARRAGKAKPYREAVNGM